MCCPSQLRQAQQLTNQTVFQFTNDYAYMPINDAHVFIAFLPFGKKAMKTLTVQKITENTATVATSVLGIR